MWLSGLLETLGGVAAALASPSYAQEQAANLAHEDPDWDKAGGASALAMVFAVTAFASPSFAQRSEDHMSAARAKALRECSLLEEKYPDSLDGNVGALATCEPLTHPPPSRNW